MELGEAHQYLYDRLDTDVGKYYSSGTDLNIGVGQVYRGVRFPLFDLDSSLFNTVEGEVYILTHECDIDQRNDRPFNDLALVIPIIRFEHWYEEFSKLNAHSPEIVNSFLGRIAKREVSRVFYFPSIGEDLPYGGLIYLNQITHTHVSNLAAEAVNRICTVTAYGLDKVDQMIQQHLLRPKDDQLALIRR